MIPQRILAAFRTPWKRTLYILFFAQLMTAVGFSIIFPFLPLYIKELGSNTNWSVELLSGLVYSGQALTMMIASPIWGAISDRYGRKMMVLRAMFGGSIILLLMAFVRSAEELIIVRTVQGLITGTVSAANALVAAETPKEHVGYAMGLLQMGMAGGVSMGPILGGALADILGYSGVFYVTAALLLISGLLVAFGVQEHFSPERLEDSRGPSTLQKWKGLIMTPGVMLTYGLRFMTRFGHIMILPIVPLFIETLISNRDQLNTTIGLVIGSAFITNALAATYLGRLGDRIGYRRILVISSIAAGLLYIPQSFVTASWQLLALQALFGITLGGMIPAISALLANYSKKGLEGVVYGLDNSVMSGARAVAPLIGAAVAINLGIREAFLITAGMFFIAAIVTVWRLPPSRQPQT